MDMQLYFVLLILWCASWSSGQFRPSGFRLTAERGGPPQGAQFVPIPTITGFPTGKRPFKKPQPITGIPPPPPEPTANTEEPLTVPITNPPPIEEVSSEFFPTSSTTIAPPSPSTTNIVVSVTQPPSTYKPQTTTTVPPTVTTAKDDGLVYNLYSQDDDGSYYFEYLTKQAAHRREQGFFKRETGFPDKVHVKTGLYSFISPEGTPVRVDYIADENGYRAYESSRVARKFANTRRQQANSY